MKKQFIKKGLCFFLIMTLFAGLLPMNAFAGWEDGIECEFCGGYRFDDWVCDDGPHCSDSSGASDCYYENHCAECLGPVENSERCDTCYACDDCINDLEYHCALCGACSEAGYEVCTDCNTCMNCQIEAGTHCGECGECLESGTQCSEHPFEMYQENHCADCGLKCPGCGDECYLDEYYDIYCEEHEACVACAADAGLHCTECYGCYEDELCCGKCYECGQESGDHCPECGIHFDWCETGGEGTHCVECAEEFICEQCNGCTWCNGTEFCDECGFCTECCIENAQSENCSCGEYCIYSGSWEDHFCENCGSCFDEYEQCEYCGHCSDCCESETECSSGMCIEDPDYEEHFCEQCNQCFDDVQLCEDCESVGELTCMDCCRERTQEMNCEHDICVNHWEWSEHYCEVCQTCFDLCEHLPEAHEHDYDEFDICKICGASRSGAPYFIHQPTEVSCNVTDINDLENRGFNRVTFRVKASGEDLTYQWFYKRNGITYPAGDDKSSGYDDCVLFEGSDTDTLTVWVKPDACTVRYEFGCGIANSLGRVESEMAKLNAKHVYGSVKPVLGESAEITYWDAEKSTEDTITYHLSSGHGQKCVGQECSEALAEALHRFSSWEQGAEPTKEYTGYKFRECIDCGYVDYEVLPVLKEPHVHDYTFGYAQGDAYHWPQCACGQKDLESREDHTFGEWKVTKPATMTATGEEQRTCTICNHVEKRSTDRQGHTHMFYDWDYIEDNGYIIEDGVEIWPYNEPYGKTNNNYHYAYCIVEGCNEVKKVQHAYGAAKWIAYPTKTSDGVWYKLCGDCGHQYDGTAKAGRYQIENTNCKVNMQTAVPGVKVKVTPYEKYDGVYFSGKFFVNFTTDLGKTYTSVQVSHHTPDESDKNNYYYFTYPEIPDGAVWTDVWVEVSPQLKKCPHRITLQNVVEETCGEAGYTGDMMCELCTYVEKAGSTIPATGEHGAGYLSGAREGTCTRKGYTGDIKCVDCYQIIEKGHVTDYYHPNYHSTVSAIYATCTSEGRTLDHVCDDCGKVLKESKVVPKRPHQWKFVESVPATETTAGKKAHYQCTVCGCYSENQVNEFISIRRFIIPPLGSVQCTEVFQDISSGWFVSSVQYVYDNGLMSGTTLEDGTMIFKPTENVTRGQLITTLYRLAGSPIVTNYSACEKFEDVKEGKYYTDAVCWAYSTDIATGNPSTGKFDTAGALTRQQMAAFFYRYAEVMGYDTSAEADCSSMLNADKVSAYAKDAVSWAVGSGLINGSQKTDAGGNIVYDLNPRGNTTRAQLAAILQRFCEGNDIF